MDRAELAKASEKCVDWLERQLLNAGRGDRTSSLDVEPSGRFWLGRLASEEAVAERGLGDRGERLEPCAIGVRIRPSEDGPWRLKVHVEACAWLRHEAGAWTKTKRISEIMDLEIPNQLYTAQAFGGESLSAALQGVCAIPGLSAEVRVEVEPTSDGSPELSVLLVNTSPKTHPDFKDTNLYETSLSLTGTATKPFLLEALPDSFRYDRRVPAYGINCGVAVSDDSFVTTDTITVNRFRPRYFDACGSDLDLSFETLSKGPMSSLQLLVERLAAWGEGAWSNASLTKRAEADLWSNVMLQEAESAAAGFKEELQRIRSGVELLKTNSELET